MKRFVLFFALCLIILLGYNLTPALAEGCFSDRGNISCETKTKALCLEDPSCYWGTCEAVNSVNQPICNSRGDAFCTENVTAGISDNVCQWKKVNGVAPVRSGPGGGTCFCYDDYTKITIDNYTNDVLVANLISECKNIPANQCSASSDLAKKTDGQRFERCQSFDNTQLCSEAMSKWMNGKEAQYKAAKEGKTGTEVNTVLSRFMPECAMKNELTDECKDVGIFIILLINISRYLFSIIGAIALLMFIYGGFIMIISQGNSEQIDKGKSAMTAAVIGLVIAFSAYLLVSFIGSVLGVSAQFLLD